MMPLAAARRRLCLLAVSGLVASVASFSEQPARDVDHGYGRAAGVGNALFPAANQSKAMTTTTTTEAPPMHNQQWCGGNSGYTGAGSASGSLVAKQEACIQQCVNWLEQSQLTSGCCELDVTSSKCHASPGQPAFFWSTTAYASSVTATTTTTSATTVANVDGLGTLPQVIVTWVGCFHDGRDGNRDLKVTAPNNCDFATTVGCSHYCYNYTYMALQNGGQCRCGNSYGTPKELYYQVDKTECGYGSSNSTSKYYQVGICKGEEGLLPTRYCGSRYRNAVYQISTAQPIGPAHEVPIVMIGSLAALALALVALAALLVIKRRKRRSGDGEDGVIDTLSRRLNNAQATRAANRWGLGSDLPAAGERTFFRAGFVPALSALESIAAFGVFDDEQTKNMRALADQKTREMVKRGMPFVRDHVELLMSFTEESDLYITLLKSSRTTGKCSERALEQHRDYLYHLVLALGNLSPYIGRVFRAIDVQVRAASYQVGSTITWQSPSSASKVEAMVTEFMGVVEEKQVVEGMVTDDKRVSFRPQSTSSASKVDISRWSEAWSCSSLELRQFEQAPRTILFGTIFVIESISGKDISMFSAFPEEEEVLFPLNCHFRVLARLETDEEKLEVLSSPTLNSFDLSKVLVYVLQQI